MRRSKNLLSLDTDSALALMQEIYNDIVEQKQTASLITKKMLSFMKEAEDMSVLGPVIKEQQNPASGGGGKLDLTDDDRKLLEKLMKEDDEPSGESQKYEM